MNYDQLTAITRRQDRVFKAKDFKALESIEFVKNVSTTACAAGRDNFLFIFYSFRNKIPSLILRAQKEFSLMKSIAVKSVR